VVGSEKTSDGVSRSGVKVEVACSWGGRAGKDLSTLGATEGGFRFLAPSSHERLMTGHAEDTL